MNPLAFTFGMPWRWLCLLWVVVGVVPTVIAQEGAEPGGSGIVLDVPATLNEANSVRLRARLKSVASRDQAGGERRIVVLRFRFPEAEREASFEAALGLARYLTGPEASPLRTVAWLDGEVTGHHVLPLLACEQIVASPNGVLGPITDTEEPIDTLTTFAYTDIASRRATIPVDYVEAMLDDAAELIEVIDLEGREQLLIGDALAAYREEGKGWQETTLVAAGAPASFSANLLRSKRFVTHIVSGIQSVADALGVAKLVSLSETDQLRPAVQVPLRGPLRSMAIGRVTAKIADAVARDVGTVVVTIDSPGGELNAAADLARYLKSLPADGVRTVAWIDPESLGSAALVAASCQQIYMVPDGRFGGPGDRNTDPEPVNEIAVRLDEYVHHPVGLIAGLIGGDEAVHRYEQKRTGRIAYFTTAQFEQREDAAQWLRRDEVKLEEGISTERALELGLAAGVAADEDDLKKQLGISGPLETLVERPLVAFVEQLANMPGLPFLLIFIGFMALSMEMGAPGVGLPGFVAVVCLVLFFWIQYLSGTVEWLELALFIAGIACLLAEVFVLPGFGIFGFGGLGMIIASLVLTSQTFVIPQNSYQYGETAKALFTVLAAVAGVVVGIIGIRLFLPHTPGLKHLVLDPLDRDTIAAREQMGEYSELVGMVGNCVTPLVPSGKVRIGDKVVQVVSDGRLVEAGQEVRVTAVNGNRIRVEPL